MLVSLPGAAGDRQKAITVGGSIVFFTLVSTGQSVLVFWGIVQAPIVASMSFMGLVAVMGYELSREVIRAPQLVASYRRVKPRCARTKRGWLGRRSCELRHLDSGSRAKRNLGERQMADVVRLHADGAAGNRTAFCSDCIRTIARRSISVLAKALGAR